LVVPVPEESAAEQQRVIDAVNRKLAGGSGSRFRQRLFFTSAAAALMLAAGFAFAHFRSSTAPAQLASTRPTGANLLKPGDALSTRAEEVRTATLENGAEVTLGGGTELSVSALARGTDELLLDRGHVELTVPKLRSGHTLSVTTPDSTVTVRGTRFSVGVQLVGSRPVTSVDVTQGSVWVRQGDTRLVLEAGSHWSSGDAAQASSLHEITPPSNEGIPAPHAATRPSSTTPAPVAGQTPPDARPESGLPPSTLAEENNLYEAAARAAREGNTALAISQLNSLLLRYPSSPLAQNARVDRFRALNRSGRAQEAVVQARRYLADYPNGFARDEAKALVLQALVSP
jgi:hypothetical protein